ncbi:MAG: glycosyltransferase family 4 protein, partial [Rubricoccaceae bacterium]
LAARGHTVRHGYSATNLTPQGALAPQPDDPETFSVDPLVLAHPVEKRGRSLSALVARRQAETAYGRLLEERLAAFAPEVVLAANTPLDALARVHAFARRRGTRIVNWLQDILSVGTHRVLRQRLPVAGDLVGRYYLGVERRLLQRADAVVAITQDFVPLLARWQVPAGRVHVVENWAPLESMPPRPKDNPWSRAQGLAGHRVVLYAGTLGLKHNPELLARLAERLRADARARVVVISEGAGADWLAEQKAARGLGNLVLLPFQPFEALPDVHGAADVLAAILEPDAGVFSVPSKVLSYLCAARPVLLAVPPENLAARIVAREGAGVVVPPTAPEAFAREAARLLADERRCAEAGRAGRAYAERSFDIDAITDRFERILAG